MVRVMVAISPPARRRRRAPALALVVVTLGTLAAGCGEASVEAIDTPGGPGPASTRADGGGHEGTGTPSDADFHILPADAVDARPPDPTGCGSLPGDDNDHDGYTGLAGDCNDCDKLVNPGAYDVAGNNVDEDCSGKPDDEPTDCDQGAAPEGDAVAAARALGLCRMAGGADSSGGFGFPGLGLGGNPSAGKDKTWGLVKAAYVFPDGSTGAITAPDPKCGAAGDPPNPLSHGILPGFGDAVKPRRGASLVVLSSGVARPGFIPRAIDDTISPRGATMCTRSPLPTGFPVSSYSTCGDLPARTGSNLANDAIALELTIRVPTNAQSMSFDFDFYTFEYQQFVCSAYNDAFVALLYSQAPTVPANHNIAFDSQNNPVSVNNGFVEVCKPFTYQGAKAGQDFMRQFPCALGVAELAGTAFEDHAATGWLQTHTNVVPGEELTLRLAIWDAGDEALDSTVLLDNLRWDVKPGSTVTVRPPPID